MLLSWCCQLQDDYTEYSVNLQNFNMSFHQADEQEVDDDEVDVLDDLMYGILPGAASAAEQQQQSELLEDLLGSEAQSVGSRN
jgi:hypothetical protein